MPDVLELSADLPESSYPDGFAVLVEGQTGGPLLVLLHGTVEITKRGTLITVIDRPGAIFGEMSVLLGGAATASVLTRGSCRFRVCDDPQAFLAERPGVALAVATTLARRLETVTGYLADLRNQYADHEDHLGVVDQVLESLVTHQGPRAEPGSDREAEAPY